MFLYVGSFFETDNSFFSHSGDGHDEEIFSFIESALESLDHLQIVR